MNENAIHGAPKKRQGWRIALEGPHLSMMKHSSNLFGSRMHERKRNSWGSKIKGEDGGLHQRVLTSQSWSIAPNSLGGGCMNENAIHGALKKRREWRIALEGPHQSIMKHGSKLFGWRMHERERNSLGSEKKARMEDCSRGSSQVNDEAQLQTLLVEDA